MSTPEFTEAEAPQNIDEEGFQDEPIVADVDDLVEEEPKPDVEAEIEAEEAKPDIEEAAFA